MKSRKILTTILCLVLVLALGGYFAFQQGLLSRRVLPDNRFTLRGLTIDAGEEEITLNPEIRLSAAADGEDAALHFEIGSGEKVFMPVSGELKADGSVNFTIGSSGRVYTLDPETLVSLLGAEQTGINPLDPALKEKLGQVVENYIALAKLQQDGKYLEKYDAVFSRMYEIMLGTAAEETEVEIEGKTYSARRYQGSMKLVHIVDMLDYMQDCESPEISGMMQGLLDIINIIRGEEALSYSLLLYDLGFSTYAEGDTEVASDVDLIYACDGDMIYQKMTMTQLDGMGGEVASTTEQITRGGRTVATMVMGGDDPENGTSSTMNIEIAEDFIHADMEYAYALNYDMAGIYMSTGIGMNFTLDGAKQDGLWNVDLDAAMNMDSSYDYGAGPETESETFALNADYAETRGEDKSITGAFDMKVVLDDADYGLAFELNRAKDAKLAELIGKDTKIHALTENTEDEVYALLAEDADALLQDASALAEDESIIALVNMIDGYAADSAVVYEDKVSGDEAAVLEEYETAIVYSYDEAAEIYAGTIPAYTAPDGFELQEISADVYSLTASYASDEASFSFMLMNFGAEDPAAAQLSPDDFTIIDDGAENPVYAQAMTDTEYFMFAFDMTGGIDMACAEAIIAGLAA